jgi:hypothetical protein
MSRATVSMACGIKNDWKFSNYPCTLSRQCTSTAISNTKVVVVWKNTMF